MPDPVRGSYITVSLKNTRELMVNMLHEDSLTGTPPYDEGFHASLQLLQRLARRPRRY